MSAPAAPAIQKGIVKQILSGDSIVIRGQPKGGPPPERTLCLSNITAPRVARRANPNVETSQETKDEVCAWEAREFLRKKLIGKEIAFTVEYKVPASNREYGTVLIPSKDGAPENVTESLVEAGLVEVRRGQKASDESQQKLVQLEDSAKAAGRGKWAADASTRIRNVKWTVEEPRKFVDSHHQKPIDAVIEHVRDGCTVRAFLLPNMDYVTVLLSGIKCPMFKQDGTSEPFAEEAKFFVESRLLQRDVQIVLEGVSNQNLLGTVLHPNGNITELLLKDGFARCVDWSMGSVTCGAEKYRAAEKAAKDKQLRIWKDYKPSSSAVEIKEKSFQGKVIEVVNGDGLVVKVGSEFRKLFLSSVRPPRPPAVAEAAEDGGEHVRPPPVKSARERPRPLYDVPYMFEAREFLRKKLVGKKVSVTVDYIQPASNNYPEKVGCTVMIGNINVGEALVSKGLATVIRYRQDDDQRSSHYDELLAAEARAIKKFSGMHSKSEPPLHRVADVTGGEIQKAKQFLPFLQRAERSEALVEFVASGSRLRLYIPRETCLITFLISGVQCPRGARPAANGSEAIAGEPFSDAALAFTREMCMQREVEIKVESMDKGGNFIGWLFVDGVSLSQALVEHGLARVHSSAYNTQYQRQLEIAEENSKSQKLGLWASFVEEVKEAVEAVVEEVADRRVNYVPVVVTEVSSTDLIFYAQSSDNGPQFEKFMGELRSDLEQNPPLPGAFTPRKGDTCVAKFGSDGQWYRARVEKVEGANVVVFYIDFGNKETTTTTKLAPLPASFHGLAPQAREYHLALTQLPNDEDAKADALDHFYQNIANKDCMLNVEFKAGGVDYATLLYADSKEDVALGMIQDGLLLAEGRREKRLNKLVTDYRQAQEAAKKNRLNLWRYGDITEDDAKEFGYQR